jgi:hypothetical protein
MKNNLTELVFILDRGGSMSGLERENVHWTFSPSAASTQCS